MNDRIRHIVKVTLNQCFCDFGQKTFRKSFLLTMSENNVETLRGLLQELGNKGYLRVLKPIDDASEQEDCVEVLKPIEWE